MGRKEPPALLFAMYLGECVEGQLKITYKCCWPKSWLSLNKKLQRQLGGFRKVASLLSQWRGEHSSPPTHHEESGGLYKARVNSEGLVTRDKRVRISPRTVTGWHQ